MSFDKYYDLLYKDGKLNREFVTYLATLHIKNSLVKKDIVTNDMINDLGCNFVTRFNKLFNNITSPLGFINDDILDFYNYTKPHLDNILDSAAQSIIKKSKLISVNKLKNIDPKTMTWLANKPGATFREKLAQVNKVSSTVKRYSMNIQANQVVYSYYKRLYRNLSYKLETIKNNPDLFGNYDSKQIKAFKVELNKLDYKFKTVFKEVTPKDYLKANNTLLGNTDYRSVWNSYVKMKSTSTNIDDVFDSYKKELFNALILRLMNSYGFIEDISKNDFSNYILYSNDEDLKIITFKNEDELAITITTYKLDNGLAPITNSKQYLFTFNVIELDDEPLGGISFRLSINDENIGIYTADLLGSKKLIDDIIDNLGFKREIRVQKNEKQYTPEFISINSFDNTIYGKKETCPQIISDSIKHLPNDLYLSNSNIVTLLDKKNDDYHVLLKNVSKSTILKPDLSIYDIKDTYDEFSSMKLRSTFASTINNSYPVWRSILAAESINDNNAKYIIDFCGDELSVSELGYKNNKFIHKGALEIPLYISKFTEYDFYDEYISKFENKYNVNYPKSVKLDFIKSGNLSKLFIEHESIISLIKIDKLDVYSISFDSDLFEEIHEKALAVISSFKEKYENSYVVLPNFLIDVNDSILNKDLIAGARRISHYVKNKAIAWYEVLPDLSLEVIRNGMYDELTLVKDQECENIIGKKFGISVQDTFVLSKGQKNYILPLNKSFVGDQNDFYVAKLEDESFPLDEDVTVRLRIEYSFGNENSYRLFFEPIVKSSFSKIEAKWEKENFNDNVINPQIIDNILTRQQLDFNLSDYLPKKVNYLSKAIENLNKGSWIWTNYKTGQEIDNFKNATNNARDLVNTKQRHDNFDAKAKEEIKYFFMRNNISEYIMQLLKLTEHYRYSDPEKYLKRRVNLEDYYMGATLDTSIFSNNFFEYSIGCYGRYFNMYPNDEKILENARNSLLKIISVNDYLNNKDIRIFMASMTSAITGRHSAIYEMAQVYPLFVRTLLDTIVDILEKLIPYNWSQKYVEGIYVSNPSENGFLVRHSLEILLSILYCRDMVIFDDLKPNGNTARKLISIIKRLNLSMMTANFDENVKVDQMRKTKYVINFELPEDLNKMWNVAYILILSLSSDERVNLIKLTEEGK